MTNAGIGFIHLVWDLMIICWKNWRACGYVRLVKIRSYIVSVRNLMAKTSFIWAAKAARAGSILFAAAFPKNTLPNSKILTMEEKGSNFFVQIVNVHN